MGGGHGGPPGKWILCGAEAVLINTAEVVGYPQAGVASVACRRSVVHGGRVHCRLEFAAGYGLWELTLTCGGHVGWFLLEPQEAQAFQAVVDELDPDLSTLSFADLCGLVRAVTGAPPDPAAARSRPAGLE